MANGNTAIIQELRAIVREGKPIESGTCDRLVLTAILDIYEWMETARPALMTYKVGAWLIGAIIIAMIGMYFK